jgi:uncharacterized protein YegL
MQDLLALHLERNPEDTERALEIAERLRAEELAHTDALDKRQWQKFESMADRNLVQAIDVDQIRNQVVGELSQQPAPLPSGAAVDSWDDPLPDGESGSDREPGEGPAPLPGLIPVYLVLDESPTVALGIGALNDGLREICDAVAGQPEIARVVRLAVLGYAGGAVVRLALQEVRREMPVPALTASPGPVQLAAVFERLGECIPNDSARLKARTPSLRRPQVLLLSGGLPSGRGSWAGAYRALVDRDSQRYAPDVIACGVGDADPRTILDLATRSELAFVAQRDVEAASYAFCVFAHRRIVEYGRAVLDGDQNATITGPDGFRPATELIASSTQGN